MKHKEPYDLEAENIHLLRKCRRELFHNGKVIYRDHDDKFFEIRDCQRYYIDGSDLQQWKDKNDQRPTDTTH